ncbi:branched-chain amino acid ABC transporter permease [Castellaniella sp.]|uniref:branched-chain amino acid ABC transporter permease n=1 Tax=Castellaniella sp. TaxID=1955812 RepID=UPI00355CC5B7
MPDLTFILQALASGIGIGCVYGLIGIGFCVIYNASGIVNFAQGAFVMLGGMMTYAFSVLGGFSLLTAAVLAIALVSALGVLIERIVVRPLWHRNSAPFVMILATLAVQIVLERATLLSAGDQPKSLPNFIDLPPLMMGGVAINYQLLFIAVASILLVAALAAFFTRTRVGRAMRACAINREAAALQGIPVARMLGYAFALSAGLGAIAGVLITPTQFTAFDVGVPFAISGFIAAIIGGFGNPAGAFVGGIILGLAQSMAIVVFGSGFKNIAALSILLAFISVRPMGLFGKAE